MTKTCERVDIPFGFYTFKAAVILDSLFYSNFYMIRHNYLVGRAAFSHLCLSFDRKDIIRGLGDTRVKYLPSAKILPTGESVLPLTYASNKRTTVGPWPILQEFNKRRKVNAINAQIANKYDINYVLNLANAVTFQWDMNEITLEDLTLFRDIIKDKNLAIKMHGEDKVRQLIGESLDPFKSNIMEMLYAEVDKIIEKLDFLCSNKYRLFNKPEEFDIEFKKTLNEKDEIYRQIIQTLIDANDQNHLKEAV